MEIWNKLQTIIKYDLTFTRIKKGYNIYPETTGRLYFADSNGARAGGYIDLYTSTCYYKPSGDVPYTATRLGDTTQYAEFETPMKLGTYDAVNAVFDYLFWSEDMNSSPTGGTSGDTSVITKEHTEYRMRQKEQVRPTDLSQDWADTGNYRDDPDFDVIVDGCQCSREFQWVLDGIICDGTNKCNKYKLQSKENCDAEWVDIQPIIEKIGEIIESDSPECGTHEYKEEWDETPYCGSYLNEEYGYNLTTTNKYLLKFAYVKRVDSDSWEMVDCGRPLEYMLYKSNSFECGWSTTKTETTYETDLCGDVAMEKYPSITGLSTTSKYDIATNHHFVTEPYPTNTDDMEEEDWVWRETGISYSYTKIETNSCDCGYYYLQWDATDEYSCGSELEGSYTGTTLYRKYIENKYCGGELLEPTGEIEWRVSDSTSCECGYRVSGGPIIDSSVGYEYVCGNDIEGLDENYMYYQKYYYTECVDGSNRVYDKENNIQYVKASHSTSAVTTCEYDEELEADTTKVVTTYRTYRDLNTNEYVVVNCNGEDYVESVVKTERSEDCGYQEKWTVSGTVCCGNLEITQPFAFTIDSTEGEWSRSGNTFTSNAIEYPSSTIMKITFTINSKANIFIDYDVSSSSYYDKFNYSNLYPSSGSSNPSINNGGASYTNKGQYKLSNVNSGTYVIYFKYTKGSTTTGGRRNVIATLSAERTSCTKFAKYNAEYFQYTVDDGENWITPEPIEYRYGSIVETNSEECGYVPTLEQWVLVCPDITYETAVSGDSCTICDTYNGAPTMFAIEKKQISYDGGTTWEDTNPLQTRTERVLKWKADKCGYTGDIHEKRWSNEYCDGTNLYGTLTTWYSSDNGNTWFEIPESATIELKEENSPQCIEEGGEEGGA